MLRRRQITDDEALASNVLDRIQLPQDAADKIFELLSPVSPRGF
jgi:hypothetical protein